MPEAYAYQPPAPVKGTAKSDTSYACAVDRWGNMFSVTPSDSLDMAQVIPGLGFTPSGRGTQTWLDHGQPSALAPGKRPRLTPNALLAFKDGRPWMPFGTPGGDAQCQSTLQFFLNMTVFGMAPQQAVEVPRFLTWTRLARNVSTFSISLSSMIGMETVRRLLVDENVSGILVLDW